MFRNQLLWTAIAASTSAQVIKVLLILIFERKWQPLRFLETGGMPSSHTASVAALSTSCGIQFGFDSPFFALSAIFGMIVMYDATGIRRASGMQAELLNDLVAELRQLLTEGFAPKPLKELLGHTYLEVFVGLLLGIGVAVLSYALFR